MNCTSISDWGTILSVQAGASATLSGLVFVAVSLNLETVLSVPGLAGRAAESLLQFVEVFFVATVALVPGQRRQFLAIELLVLGVLFWAAQTRGLVRYLRGHFGQPLEWFVHRAILVQVATIPFCVAGMFLLAGNCNGLYWIVPGFIFSFAAGLVSAWVLLVEVLR